MVREGGSEKRQNRRVEGAVSFAIWSFGFCRFPKDWVLRQENNSWLSPRS